MAVQPSDLKNFHHKGLLSFLHLNARSLENKHDDLHYLINATDISFDAIMVCETWYKNSSVPFLSHDYQTFALNRPLQHGGGVMLLMKNSFNVNPVPEFTESTDDYEIVTARDNSQFFSVLYRPPKGDLKNFLLFLESLLDFISLNKYSLFLGGDLNIDILKTSKAKNDFLSILESYGFLNIINEPTRVTSVSATLLDLFITNTDKSVSSCGALASDISDHLPIFAFIHVKDYPAPSNDPPICRQDITQSSLASFRADVQCHDWSHVLSSTDVNAMYKALVCQITDLYQKHFPSVARRRNRKSRKRG